MAPSDALNGRLFTEPQRAMPTPSASPSVGPPDCPRPKRPRLRSTPSSAISVTPSTSNESTTSSDVNSARRASTLRVLNTWAQLAERYNKRLDEDDIIDLHRCVIIKDRGAVKSASKEYHIGHFTLDSDQDYPDVDQDQEDSEQDDDENEIGALPPSETTTDDDAPISKKELLRGVPPLSATTDAEDLKEFLEAERKRRELAGDNEEEEDMSPEQRCALRKELEERSKKREVAVANQVRDAASVEPPLERETDATPTRLTTSVPPSDDDSEDELALWTHDESTAIYPVARDESEQDVHEAEVIELTDSDSDEEFEAILTHPPHLTRVTSLPTPQPQVVQSSLRSPPDSGRGRSKSRTRSQSKIKPPGVILEFKEHRSPLDGRKPEIISTHKRKPSAFRETNTVNPDGESDKGILECISPTPKGKEKEILPLAENSGREKILKSREAELRSRKRKRIASSSINGSPLAQSPAEPKGTLRGYGRLISTTPLRPDGSKPTLDRDVTTPGPSRSISSLSSPSRNQPSILSIPVQPISHDRNSNGSPVPDLPIPVTFPYSQRHPSHPPSTISPPSQGTSGLSLPAHPPPPIDPMQTQQAHYLLAQAMHQLSYLLSATMPSYTAYASNPGQSWQYAPPLTPHVAHNTPVHHPSRLYGSHHYRTPSVSISRPELSPLSPVRSSVSPPFEEQCPRSRGRSKCRGRRVSFKLDSEEIIGSKEHNTQPEPQQSGQKDRKQTHEVKRERGKGNATDNTSRPEEGRGSPPEVARGRTPGPLSRRKIDVPRGRSLSRR